MRPNVAVLGASGVYGRHLIPRLIARGYRVQAVARRPGPGVRVADIFDREALTAALAGCDVAVNLATTLGSGDFAENDRLRRDGTPIFLAACQDAGVSRVLQQGIALVHAGGGDAWADEETFFPPDDSVAGQAIAAALDMERSVAESALDWAVLRGGLFYGPGTGLDDDWFERARAGKLRLPGDGIDFVSLVRIEDMAAATVAALDRWPSRQALIVADDEPARWRDVFASIMDSPEPGGRAGFPSWRVRNGRAKDVLAWKPFYPNFRTGLVR